MITMHVCMSQCVYHSQTINTLMSTINLDASLLWMHFDNVDILIQIVYVSYFLLLLCNIVILYNLQWPIVNTNLFELWSWCFGTVEHWHP